jgi:mRNA-degrading endonuclease YafQ of YafQ-DinJ toxin-antitoxin module
MKFRRTPKFSDDFDGLPKNDQDAVKEAYINVSLALQGNNEFHRKYRIKKMEGHPMVWEGHIKINLCFTFHKETDSNGEEIVFFRRVGTHQIYNKP